MSQLRGNLEPNGYIQISTIVSGSASTAAAWIFWVGLVIVPGSSWLNWILWSSVELVGCVSLVCASSEHRNAGQNGLPGPMYIPKLRYWMSDLYMRKMPIKHSNAKLLKTKGRRDGQVALDMAHL